MREQLQARIDVLKNEFEAGQARLRELERQESLLRETMLRISGAIQVLQELIDAASEEDQAGGSTHNAGASS